MPFTRDNDTCPRALGSVINEPLSNAHVADGASARSENRSPSASRIAGFDQTSVTERNNVSPPTESS